ncbi:MAG: hypothetical protein LC800_08505, partial [Acidobacteria bacterium]|nr:hypothetical protein [Acidobacteriota bacterium]
LGLGDDESWAEELLRRAEAGGGGMIEREPLLRSHAFESAYPLRRDGDVLGLMLVDASQDALTDDARAVLEVIAGQVAIAIEDRRLMEENLGLERKLAQGERLAALGRMAATVAHEVKNPLSAIKSIAQVLREDERLRENYGRDLDLIVGETDRLSRSVSQLLSFARQPPPADPPARADELTRAVCDLFRAQARGRHIAIDCRAEVGDVLEGARVTAVRDALSNLLLNAIQATRENGRVTVENTREPGSIVWAVADSGAGVPAEVRPRIWEPFFTTKQRGTGLGLAIVKKRIEDAGGSVRLAPQPAGEGARFELRLPSGEVEKESRESQS